MLLILLLIVVCLATTACVILQQPRFGKAPEGERLKKIEESPNYQNGAFKNLIPTETLAKGQSTFKILVNNLFSSHERLRPEEPLPTVKTRLTGSGAIDPSQDLLIWLGHSSYFIQLGGKRILVDPVFSDHGGPFWFINKTFPGTDIYSAEDMPKIDCLLISHDHWDHLDYPRLKPWNPKLPPSSARSALALISNIGATRKKKYGKSTGIRTCFLKTAMNITVVPARHYSGRLFTKNKTLWAGFVIETLKHRMFLSGDTGYGPHLADIARDFGTFDLVALDGGQYDPRWPLIHMTPEQTVQTADEMGAKNMLLAHVGRFCISTHPWDEPFIRAVAGSKDKKISSAHP